jgi:hypothetical protein
MNYHKPTTAVNEAVITGFSETIGRGTHPGLLFSACVVKSPYEY